MPQNAEGGIERPKHGVATVVEVAERWETLMGPLDGTTRAIVSGRYVVPWTTQPTRRDWRPNHKSWEQDPKAKAALGGKLAEWIYLGIMGVVLGNVPNPPVTVSPFAAVDKTTAPFYRLVQDAREPNKGVAPWKVKYYTAGDLALMLDYGDILFALDLADAYHLAALPGCHTRRRMERWFEAGPDGSLTMVERQQLRIGCSSCDCSSFCDKSMAAVMLEGQLYRLEACHFGQATAGAPLAYLVNTVRRHFAGRTGGLGPAPRAWLGRGALPSVVWVDDTAWVVKGSRHGM